MPGRGTNFDSERITIVDRETGVESWQVTSAPVNSVVLYFEHQSFLADDRRFLLLSQRMAERGAPWDLFRVDADAMNLVQLSDANHPLDGPATSNVDARTVYATRGNALLALDVETCAEREIARCDGLASVSAAAISGDDRYYVALGILDDGRKAVVRFATDGSAPVVFHRGVPFAHMTVNHAGTKIMYRGEWEGRRDILISDVDGENLRPLAFQGFAHRTWFGGMDRFQGTLLPPGRGIVHAGLDDAEPVPICGGPYFWHSGVNKDGAWIIADTNWPDEGIVLVHVASGRFTTLVRPAGTLGHGQETHPHPSFNRAGTKAIYTSNETGRSQVYVCDVPAWMREDLATGRLTHRRKFRPA